MLFLIGINYLSYYKKSKNEEISEKFVRAGIQLSLKKNEKSHWQRLTKNEILHFYSGAPLEVFTSSNGVDYELFSLGIDDNYIYTVKANTWFAMRSAGSYSLIGCTVAPAFDFNDFELAPATWRPEKFKIEL